jgi:hypothetical protein
VLLNPIVDNGILRLGFTYHEGNNVRVKMRGRLVVDPSVLDLVRTKFPNPNSEIRAVEEDVFYDTINLGLETALVSGSTTVLTGGIVEFDLLLDGIQFTQTMLRLAQPFGIDASVNWSHQRLKLGNHTSALNVSLGRTEMALMINGGQLKNMFKHPLDVDYVMDGTRILSKGFPIRIAAGATHPLACETALCYAPGAAIRHQLIPTELSTWFSITTGASIVQQYIVENQLESDPAMGGTFRSLVLDVTFVATPGAAPQQTGPFTLGPRGSAEARKTLSFLGPSSGGGKLSITGRAYWGNGQSYHDIPIRTVESSITLIDIGWLKTTPKQ